MKQLLIILLAVMASCGSQPVKEQKENSAKQDKEEKAITVPLNNGARWKADELTKKNVAVLMQVVNDSAYTDAGKRSKLYMELESKIAQLIRECRMQGADHDALHAWLEKVQHDLKEIKEEDEYDKAVATLKKDIADFYVSFE